MQHLLCELGETSALSVPHQCKEEDPGSLAGRASPGGLDERALHVEAGGSPRRALFEEGTGLSHLLPPAPPGFIRLSLGLSASPACAPPPTTEEARPSAFQLRF